jgi:hypothetical protein
MEFPMKYFLLLIIVSLIANAQSVPRNDLTFTGGYTRATTSNGFETHSATGLGLGYGYRVTPIVDLEAGIFTAFDPIPATCNQAGCYNGDNRFLWVPFGARFVIPVGERVELSAGGGGLYERFSVSNPNPALGGRSYMGWGGYFAAGAAIALDRGKHSWLGTTPRWFLANSGNQRDRWFMIGGDLSFRF